MPASLETTTDLIGKKNGRNICSHFL